jgi:uncharacterized RDD family membrane protein YckC
MTDPLTPAPGPGGVSGEGSAPEPAPSAPSEPASSWSAAPPPAAPPPPAPAAASPGSAGLVYGDVPNRAIAYILDAIIIGLINLVVFAIVAGIGLSTVTVSASGEVSYNFISGLVLAVIGLVISGVYFIYTWTALRGTLGMRVLGLQVGNAPDGVTISTQQGVRRWLALGAVFTIAQVFNPFDVIGIVISIAAFAWFIFLLYTTYSSPTKQGWHDHFANTMVVKATRTVG